MKGRDPSPGKARAARERRAEELLARVPQPAELSTAALARIAARLEASGGRRERSLPWWAWGAGSAAAVAATVMVVLIASRDGARRSPAPAADRSDGVVAAACAIERPALDGTAAAALVGPARLTRDRRGAALLADGLLVVRTDGRAASIATPAGEARLAPRSLAELLVASGELRVAAWRGSATVARAHEATVVVPERTAWSARDGASALDPAAEASALAALDPTRPPPACRAGDAPRAGAVTVAATDERSTRTSPTDGVATAAVGDRDVAPASRADEAAAATASGGAPPSERRPAPAPSGVRAPAPSVVRAPASRPARSRPDPSSATTSSDGRAASSRTPPVAPRSAPPTARWTTPDPSTRPSAAPSASAPPPSSPAASSRPSAAPSASTPPPSSPAVMANGASGDPDSPGPDRLREPTARPTSPPPPPLATGSAHPSAPASTTAALATVSPTTPPASVGATATRGATPGAPSAHALPPPPGEAELVARAIGELRDGDARRALATLDVWRARFPSGRLAPEASVARVDALVALDHPREALAALEPLPLDGPRRRDLLVLRGELRLRAGRPRDALADFAAANVARVASGPRRSTGTPSGGARAITAASGAAASVTDELDERTRYGRASALAAARDWPAARAELRAYLERYPGGRFAAAARRALAAE